MTVIDNLVKDLAAAKKAFEADKTISQADRDAIKAPLDNMETKVKSLAKPRDTLEKRISDHKTLDKDLTAYNSDQKRAGVFAPPIETKLNTLLSKSRNPSVVNLAMVVRQVVQLAPLTK